MAAARKRMEVEGLRRRGKVLSTPAPRWRTESRPRCWRGGIREARLAGPDAAARLGCGLRPGETGKSGRADQQRRNDGLEVGEFRDSRRGRGLSAGRSICRRIFKSRTGEIQKDITEAQATKQEADKRAAEMDARLNSLGADIEKFRVEAKARDGAGSRAHPPGDGAADRKDCKSRPSRRSKLRASSHAASCMPMLRSCRSIWPSRGFAPGWTPRPKRVWWTISCRIWGVAKLNAFGQWRRVTQERWWMW